MKNAYLNAIREQIDRARRLQASNCIRWEVGEDERTDPTLVSRRAYGTSLHTDVVMVACGTEGIWQPLPRGEIILPTLLQLQALRQRFGLG